MALPLSFLNVKLADNTVKTNGEPETTTWSVPVVTMSPANAAAQITAQGNLRAAVQALILGNPLQAETVYTRAMLGNGPADDDLAQRENKWLLRYHDATTYQKAQVSIGTADLTKKMAHSEFVDLTGGDGAALKTAFEAVVVSPFNSSNAVILDSVQFVGRNT